VAGGATLLNLPGLCAAAGLTPRLLLATLAAGLRLNSSGALAGSWGVMLLAMMAPLLARPVDHVWAGSSRRRRGRAASLFALGYFALWLAFGAVELAVAAVAHTVAQSLDVAPFLLAAAAAFLWQASPWKQHCLNRCHSMAPLAPLGIRADADALLFGARHAAWCVGSCWAIMVLPLAAGGWHLPVMAAAAGLALAERLDKPRPCRWALGRPLIGSAAARRIVRRTFGRAGTC
jgi:predicted metal-binding membrane protein